MASMTEDGENQQGSSLSAGRRSTFSIEPPESEGSRGSRRSRRHSFVEFAASFHVGQNIVLEDDNSHGLNSRDAALVQKREASEANAGTATTVVNIVNNIIGAGMLTMPSACKEASIVTALALMIFIGLISATSFVLIGYLCSKLNCVTYRQLWGKIFGSQSGIVVEVCLLVNSVFGCLAYVILTCDLVRKTIEGFWSEDVVPSRAATIWISTVLILLPLCYLKSLAALKYTSILAIIAIIYVCALVQVSYWGLEEGKSRLGDNTFKIDSGILVAIGLFNSAYKAHYNAPTYYSELGCDFGSFMYATGIAFATCIAIYISFCISAFGIYGKYTKGNILKNFSPEEVAVLLCWLAMALVTMFSYPLVFKTGRDALFTLIPPLGQFQESSPWVSHLSVVTFLVATISLLACFLEDVSLVVGLGGATVGAALCWAIPASMYLKVVLRSSGMAIDAGQLSRSLPMKMYAGILFFFSLGCMIFCSIRVFSN